jgi:heterodisulfide reductase subunit A
MYTAKHAMLYQHHVPDGQAYIFYIDIRSGGKNYEEFVQRAVEEDNVVYFRGKVSKVFQENGKVKVWGVDTLAGKDIEIDADMVVLAQAMVPTKGTTELAKKLKISMDKDGFLAEAHPKLRPVESITAGMYLAGAAQAPKDIPEAVAQASGAASKVLGLFSSENLQHDPIVADVDEEVCSACKLCIPLCPYDARVFDEEKNVVVVNEILCEGCGSCVAACPSGASQQKNFTDDQIYSMVDIILEGE